MKKINVLNRVVSLAFVFSTLAFSSFLEAGGISDVLTVNKVKNLAIYPGPNENQTIITLAFDGLVNLGSVSPLEEFKIRTSTPMTPSQSQCLDIIRANLLMRDELVTYQIHLWGSLTVNTFGERSLALDSCRAKRTR